MALTRATDKIIGNADGNLNLSGIVTASSFRGDGSQLTGIDASTLKNGSDTKAQANASGVVVTGVLTATSFRGDGSNLTNLPAGLGTALSSDQTSANNKLYYTNRVLSIGSTTTVDHPATASGAYTQYAEIQIEDNADLIIEDGDDLIPDILGLGDNGSTGAGGLGRLRVDTITNKSANGAPNFPNGLTGTAGTFTTGTFTTGTFTSGTFSGIVTATSFVGGGSTIYDDGGAIFSGIVTAIGGVGLGTTTTAGRDAGIGTAVGTMIFNSTQNQLQVYANNLQWRGFSPVDPTLSSISGSLYAGTASNLTLSGLNFKTANLQVRFVQATRSVDATVTVTPSSDTAATVAVPASVYNNVQSGDSVSITLTNSDFGVSNTVTRTTIGLPTGGTITTSGSFRIHSFTSSGTFTVPSGTTLSNVEYLVVAGGGGGGGSQQGHQGGGGGAGGLRTSVVGATSGRGSSAESRITMAPASYTITVGGGGGGAGAGGGQGGNGSNSSIIGGSVSITSTGGGGGGSGRNNGGSRQGNDGGCGGGSGSSDQTPSDGGDGTSGQGYDGGNVVCQGCGKGSAGGGTGAAGSNGGTGGVSSGNGAVGGAGLSNSIRGSASTYGVGGDCTDHDGNYSLGGANTGDGGDGGYTHGASSSGADGGSGIVVIRYILQGNKKMTTYAKVVSGKVVKSIIAEEKFFDEFVDDSPGSWINISSVKGTCIIGNYYDGTGFYSDSPYASWTLNSSTYMWDAPVSYPTDGKTYEWNESTKSWDVTTDVKDRQKNGKQTILKVGSQFNK